jgi:hypothetical protein
MYIVSSTYDNLKESRKFEEKNLLFHILRGAIVIFSVLEVFMLNRSNYP